MCISAAVVVLQEGKELIAKSKAAAAVKADDIKVQLAKQLAERARREQQEKQEDLDYAQVEQVCVHWDRFVQITYTHTVQPATPWCY